MNEPLRFLHESEAYWEPCETSMMGLFAKIVNGF